MTRVLVLGGALVAALVAIVLVTGRRERGPGGEPGADLFAPIPSARDGATDLDAAGRGFLYGRVTLVDGAVYEGRLRWGGDEEACWSDYFNGLKDENPWAVHVPPAQLEERHPIEIFGVRVASRARPIELGRPFMARLGDIRRIEAQGGRIRVTLKSGTEIDLDRFSADDLADGLRVWDATQGVADFGERRIRTVDFLSTPRLEDVPGRLHGKVRTRQRDFSGYIQWNRTAGVGTDRLDGRTAGGNVALRFDTIRSIARNADDGSVVTVEDGRQIELSGTREVGPDNHGIYVDDRRYGRVLVSWQAFERVDFSPGGGGPAYDDFPPGRPLTGSVVTRTGGRHAGRLVYDLDESETTETLDAPYEGVTYTIPFGLIASIALPDTESGTRHVRVALHGGELLELERAGDLADGNAGVLIFTDGVPRPEFVPWAEVERIDLDRPLAMYPPIPG